MNTDREQYIEGLRQLAQVLEDNPEIELPTYGTLLPMSMGFFESGGDRDRMAAAARAFPCTWQKSVHDSETQSYFNLDGRLAGLRIQLSSFRDLVCTRRVVGTEDREVEEEVTPAVTRKVVKPVEVVEWDCGPILRPAASQVMSAAATCPICSAPLAPDGSHISATSGAYIPAEPQACTP